MKRIQNLIPEDIKSTLNQSPAFRWGVLILFVLVGTLIIVKGVRGFRKGEIESKGQTYTGMAARFVSGGFIFAGVLLIGGAAVFGIGLSGQ